MSAPRILVVDDNQELLTLLSSSFEEAGYEVSKAARGRNALDLARKERPDLVILDILLPDLMGFDVAEALRRLRIPFIFMSGVHKGGKASSIALNKYGALAYFEKPFERAALLKAVAKAVPAGTKPKGEAWDVEAGPQVAEAAEAMQLTGRVEILGQAGALRGGGNLQLKPMAADQAARLRQETRPISAKKVTTGPIAGGDQTDALQQLPAQKDGIRRGELQDNLPQLLAAFYNAKATGELGLQKGQVKKVIYFEGGMPVFALSNLVADRLGQFLVRAGKIDEGTLKKAADDASRTKRRTGDLLISMGALTEDERLYYVGQQIKSILYSVFAWEEGSYYLSFQERARKEAIKLDIHPANLIQRGVKKLYKLDRLRRLLPDAKKPTPSQDPLFNLSDVELQAWEAHLLPRCDGSKPVGELVKTSGKPEQEVLGLLVALTSMRIIDVK